MEPDFSRRLSPAVYRGDAFELAQNHLLGAYLCSEIDGELTAGMITELEVYIGSCDLPCLAEQENAADGNHVQTRRLRLRLFRLRHV